jgi:aminomethyltransferase
MMKRTPLYDRHVAAGAKLVDFAGWEMPIQYSGVVDEYQTVRTAAGLFDVSHMGRFTVEGRDALAFLQKVVTSNVEPLAVGAAQYSMVCNQTGGIKDDIFIYRLAATRFLLCINASNRDKVFSWFCAKAPQGDVRLSDESDELAQIALQGPRSPQIMRTICPAAADSLKPRHCLETDVLGALGIVSRTGYTGEVGYELYLPAPSAKTVWDALMKAGASAGLKPCGLGSRDLLRLEVGYLLYGNDIDEQTTPLEATGPAKRLVGFELLEKGVPRHGMKILADGQDVGLVSSGNLSPRLQKGIGLGYVPVKLSEPGTPLQIDIRGRMHPAVVVKLPFYQRTKA